eukprot:scaffold7805_cov116-Isochrysis_galbana.AAC.3
MFDRASTGQAAGHFKLFLHCSDYKKIRAGGGETSTALPGEEPGVAQCGKRCRRVSLSLSRP